MNRLDIIIDALEGYFDNRPLGLDKMHQALAAARELRALEPVGYMDKKGSLFNHTTHPHLCTPLYSLLEQGNE